MRKKFLIVILLTIFCAGIFTACNVKTSLRGQFAGSEYILSVDEKIDFEDKLDVKGVDKNKVEISSSDENVVRYDGDFRFIAISSGKAYIFANYNNQALAKVPVFVKIPFSTPQNVTCDPATGLVTWDKSFAMLDGEQVYPDQYQISCGEFETSVNDNSFNISSFGYGSHQISVSAISNNKYIENSAPAVKDVNYGVMDAVTNLKFVSGDFTQNGYLSWDEMYNAQYDVEIDGAQIATNLEENRLEIDFSKYGDNKELTVAITAKDTQGVRSDTRTTQKIKTLAAPNFEYKFDEEGYLAWDKIEGATAYKIGIKNVFTQEEKTVLLNSAATRTNLEEMEDGVYDVCFMAVGRESGEIIINSRTSEVLRVGKLPKPNVQTSFNGKQLTLTVNGEDTNNKYIKNYKIAWEGGSQILKTENEGTSITIDLSVKDFTIGQQKLTVTSLPNIQNDHVEDYTYRNDADLKTETVSNVLNSNDFVYNFTKLAAMSEITHKLDEKSLLTFDKIEGVNFYEVYLNNQKIESFETTEEAGKVTLSIANLKNYAPNDNKYTFRIEAGYKDTEERAIRSVNEKEITILPLVTADKNQTNGKFVWNSLENILSKFNYEIIQQTDEEDKTVVQPKTVNDPRITETLEAGFYKIKIKSISVDTNEYLDSDFHDANNVTTVEFKVTTTLESPNAKLIEDENGKLTLEIDLVEHAGYYQVTVDDTTTDGTPQRVDEGDKLTYELTNNLASSGAHTIKVVAQAGDYNHRKEYSSEIYFNSQPFIVNVVRLKEPKIINLKDIYEDLDLVGQEIEVEQEEGSTGAKFLLNNVDKGNNGFVLQMKDSNEFGTNFSLDISLIGQTKNDITYLSSAAKKFDFERVATPSEAKFNKGQITWNNGQHTNNVYFAIKFAQDNNNYHTRFTTDDVVTSYNFQEYIENNLKDNAFKTAYQNAKNVVVEIISMGEGEQQGKYYLNSLKSSPLTISYLAQIKLTVDIDKNTISWNKETNNTTFDIYIDGQLKNDFENYSQASITTSILSSKGIDFLTKAVEISVMAKDDGYLDSIMSDKIYIKEIVAPNKVTINKSADKYTATIAIETDSSNIEKVEVNGTDNNVTVSSGQVSIGDSVNFSNGTIILDLEKFSGTEDFSVIFKAKSSEGSNSYFFHSKPFAFKLKDLSKINLTSELEDKKLTFSKTASDIHGCNEDTIIYELCIEYENNGTQKYCLQLTEEELSLNSIESRLPQDVKLKDALTLSLYAYVSNNYYLTGENAVGYYGKTQISQFNSYKLASIDKFTLSLEKENTSQSGVENEVNSSLKIEFDDLWQGIEKVKSSAELIFKVSMPSIPQFKNIPLKAGMQVPSTYSFTHENGKYTLVLKKSILNFAAAGSLDVEITVEMAKAISSQPSTLTLTKLAPLSESTVLINDEGKVTITDNQDDVKYLLEVSYGTKRSCVTIDKKEYNLLDIKEFNEYSGDYEINLCVFDGTEKPTRIPSAKYTITGGRKLNPISNITIDDVGDLILTLEMENYDGIHFLVRKQTNAGQYESDVDVTNKVFEENESSHVFKISMIDTILAFDNTKTLSAQKMTYEFSITKPNSIKAQYKSISFNYNTETNDAVIKRVASGDEDYIILDEDQNGKETTSIRVNVHAKGLDLESEVAERKEENIVIFFKTKDDTKLGYYSLGDKTYYLSEEQGQIVKGFWVNGDQDGYFTTIEPSEGTKKACYGIALSSVLDLVDYGDVEIEVSRVVKDKEGSEVYQNGSTSFKKYKLCQVQNFEVRDGILRISWNQLDEDYAYDEGKSATMYMVLFNKDVTTAEKVVSKKVFTNNPSLDLNSLSLTPGEIYDLKIVAISQNLDIVASSESDATYNTIKFTTPLSLEVKNGKITFNIEEFKKTQFFTDINKFFTSTEADSQVENYYITAARATYMSPFYFTAATLSQALINLTLTDENSHKVYTISRVNAIDLLPDVKITPKRSGYTTTETSYFDLLSTYYDSIKNQSGSAEIEVVKPMLSLLIGSTRGVADNATVIDNLNAGRSLPEGKYSIKATQAASSVNISSDNSDAINLYITPPPEIKLQTEVEVGSGNTIYYAYVKEVNTMFKNDTDYETALAKVYKMQINSQSNPRNIVAYLIIDKMDDNWKLTYSVDGQTYNSDIGDLENIISDTQEGFKLNLSALKDALNKKKQVIEFNEKYNVNIFAYNGLTNDDQAEKDYVTNGKCGTFDLRYLSLDANSITFRNGKFQVKSNQANEQDVVELLLRYKKDGSNEASKVIPIRDNNIDVDFDETGKFDYLIFSLQGSIKDYKEVNVESQSYYVANVYKPQSPKIETRYNKLLINFNDNDVNSFSEILKFNITNDKETEYYYSGDLTKGNKTHVYTVGTKKNVNEFAHPSEVEATSFTIYLSGNAGSFTSKEATEEDFTTSNGKLLATYILEFTPETGDVKSPVLSSAPSTINAKMLSGASQQPTVKNGGISVEKTDDVENLKDGIKLIYKVEIEYYAQNPYSSEGYARQASDTFYLERLDNKEKYIDGRLLKTNYQYYKAYVTMIVAKEAGESQESFTTIEGNKYSYADQFYFTSENSGDIAVLQSEVKESEIFERTSAPTLVENNKGTLAGQLNFVIENFEEEPQPEQLKVVAKYKTTLGADTEVEIKGTFKFEKQNNNKLIVKFTPEDNQLNDVSGKIEFEIYVWGEKDHANMIWSSPLSVKDVTKLSAPTAEYYSIELNDKGNTILDFKEYFNKVNVDEKNNGYQIVIEYFSGDEKKETKTLKYASDAENYIFEILDEYTKLTIQVQDAQEDTVSGEERQLLLNSDTLELNLSVTPIENFAITWNKELQRFEWTFDGMEEEENRYIYYVTLKLSDNKEEKTFTTEKYYMPKNIGTISNFSVRVRLLNEQEGGINRFTSDNIFENGEEGNVEYNLFSQGNGSQGNPYIIKDEKAFKNMLLRNTSEFYFKLDADINITSWAEFKEFNAHLDGNSKTITISQNSIFTTEELTLQLIDSKQIKFTQYSALFHTITSEGSIEKLTISYTVNSTLNKQNVLFAPIALYNYGNIKNVNVSTTTITLKASGNSDNNAFIGGIVALNYGQIKECYNNSTLDISLPDHINLGYASISVSNNGPSGVIQDCFNKQNKTVTSSSQNSTVYLAGITLINTNKISRCGNDGQLSLKAKDSSTAPAGYFAGIVLTSTTDNSTLEYLYDNGSITNSSSASFNFAGIVYNLSGGTINTLIETSNGQPIVKVCSQSPTQSGTCYAPSNASTAEGINVSTLQSFNSAIDCGEGYKMTVENGGQGYTAKITQNNH